MLCSEVTRIDEAEANVRFIKGSRRTQALEASRRKSISQPRRGYRLRNGNGAYSPPATGPKTKGIPKSPMKLGTRMLTYVTC
ncbi:hypothetical protein D3C80_2093320 [compost metagenome]